MDEQIKKPGPNTFEALTEEKIAELSESGREERQQLLNDIFTPERREQMLQSASVDSSGRRVLYYREMSDEAFLKLLSSHEQQASNYYDKYKIAEIERRMRLFLACYARLYLDQRIDYGPDQDLEQMFNTVFPGNEEETADLVQSKSLEKMVSFVERHVPLDYQKIMHTSGEFDDFTSFLSASVGGPIIPQNVESRTFVEMVVPDEEVIPNQHGVEGEKEVLLKRIRLEWVSRVYTSQEQLADEVTENPNTPIGKYYGNIEPGRTAAEKWRWDERTRDYLPVTLVRQMDAEAESETKHKQ